MSVALVHDYLTQRGGAERVVLALLSAFPGAPLYTSLYDPEGTFPELASADVRTLPLNRLALLRHHHRIGLPLFAGAFSRLEVDADVVVCSSSGWSHGAGTTGRKVVYCHTPARWLYQHERYLGDSSRLGRLALAPLRRPLTRWDHRAAASAHRYLANSTVVRDRVRALYGIDAEIVPPPHAMDPEAPRRPVPGVDPGFVLCVSRLLPYKNVEAVIEAFADLPGERLVVVGTGPLERRLRATAPANVSVVGRVDEPELRWLYGAATALVAASYEDFGLTPLEAAASESPVAALRWGGFLDTVVEGTTGVFFDQPTPSAIRDAVIELRANRWDGGNLIAHGERYSVRGFAARMRSVVAEESTGRQ
jgi:glycosyltransferase involved in cell wall biosynthesis